MLRWPNSIRTSPVAHFLLATGLILCQPTRAAAQDSDRLLLRLGTTRFQTRGFATDLAFSPDGKTLAVAEANSPSRVVRLFDVPEGTQQAVLADPDGRAGWVTALAFSPDGTLLLCGEMDGRATVWDVKTRKPLAQRKTHRGEVQAVTFSKDGSQWATGAADGRVEIRSTAGAGRSGRLISVGHAPQGRATRASRTSGIAALRFTDDAQRLVIAEAGNGGTISVVSVADRKKLTSVSLGPGDSTNPSLNYIALLPDGKSLLTAGQRTVPRDQTTIPYGPTNVTLTRLNVFDMETGKKLRSLHDKDDYGFGYAGVSRDGKRVVVSDFGQLSCRDVESGNVVWRTKLPGTWGSQPVFSPDGQYVALRYGSGVSLFNGENGDRLHSADNKGCGVVSAAWAANGQSVVIGHRDGFIRIWNASTGELEWEQEMAPVLSQSGRYAMPHYVGMSGDATTVFAAGIRDDPVDYREGLITAFDRSTHRQLFEISLRQRVAKGSLSPDGRVFVVAASNGSIGDTHLYGVEVETGKLLFANPAEDVRAGLWGAEALGFDATAKRFRVATGNSEIVTFDSMTGEELKRVSVDWRTQDQIDNNKPRWAQLWEGSFDATATTLVSSSAEFVYVWDAETGQPLGKYRQPHMKGCYVHFSADRRTVAAADLQYSRDYGEDILRLIDPETGQHRLSIPTPGARAHVLAFSPDGTKLLTGMTRGAAKIWDVKPSR